MGKTLFVKSSEREGSRSALMGKIIRNPGEAERVEHDLIIIGGGAYGIMLSVEASRRKLRSLLLEKEDFGGATSANSLRIVHGGLRYLQGLDLHRFRESVAERRWFRETFPEMVASLPCLMPLYGEGLRRPAILRLALKINNFLSGFANSRHATTGGFPDGKVIDAENTRRIFPQVDPMVLKGGAIWYDGLISDPQRVLLCALRSACMHGAAALNYMETRQIVRTEKGVAGVSAVDGETGLPHEFHAPVVINASGPWCRELSRQFDRDIPVLFKGSIAWNVLFRRKALSDHALAVAPKAPGGRTYFLVPWKGMLLAGTGHAPRRDMVHPPQPTDREMEEFIAGINAAVPSLEISGEEILRIFPGYLPVKEEGNTRLTDREVIFDHGKINGPRGLYSVSGVKFTTSRLVAEKTLQRIFPDLAPDGDLRDTLIGLQREKAFLGVYDFSWEPNGAESGWEGTLRSLIEEESVVHLDDLIFRRSSIGDNPERVSRMAPQICDLFGWDESRKLRELKRIHRSDHCPETRTTKGKRGA